MSPLRYRRTSVRTALGVTKEEKRIKRALGITAILKPFRWWGNEKRKIKREVGYYSPEGKLVRHFFPHAASQLLLLILMLVGAALAYNWYSNSAKQQAPAENWPAPAAWPATASGAAGDWR